MDARRLTDERILDILESDSQKGIVLLMEKYTALLWHVSSLYVRNPEDIKECVNDSFSEFYFHRKRFNPKKSSLSAYLTAIARNKAVSCYRKEQRENSRRADILAEELEGDDSQIAKAELRTDIERAMKFLKPNELQVIRMKYYDGMSVREIAESLNLPYETVKKRHQRSILKLGKSLMITLVLIFILTACVYGVLRYFDVIPPINLWTLPWKGVEMEEPEKKPDDDRESGGRVQKNPLNDMTGEEGKPEVDLPEEGPIGEISAETPLLRLSPEAQAETIDRTPGAMEDYTVVPGYGVNENPKEAVYTLAKKESLEKEEYSLTLEEVLYTNHKIIVKASILLKKNMKDNMDYMEEKMNVDSLTFQGNIFKKSFQADTLIDSHTSSAIYKFENVSLPNMEKGIENMCIQFTDGDSILFNMVSAEQKKVTGYPYQIGDLGGILAIPRLEDESLIIAIHPLDDRDELRIIPAIVVEEMSSGPKDIITVTGEDGTVYPGECIRYHPRGEETYFEWDFGKVKPGSYTLNVPWVYLKTEIDEDIDIALNPVKPSWEDKKYQLAKGSIWLQECVPIDEKPKDLPDYYWTDSSPTIRNWSLRFGASSVYAACPFTCIYSLQCMIECYNPDLYDKPGMSRTHRLSIIPTDGQTGILEYVLMINTELANPENMRLHIDKGSSINFRWNQSFEIPFTVEKNN